MEDNLNFTEQLVNAVESYLQVKDNVTLDGESMTIGHVLAAAECPNVKIAATEAAIDRLETNSTYLAEKISGGCVIYGINTGYGGSADVRSDNLLEVQRSLLHHLNGGFGPKVEPRFVRALMSVRANSLSKGYSGVRPEVVECLMSMLNKDIVPVVPLRGTISASGDLMPTSYVASAMMCRKDSRVLYQGEPMTMPEAVEKAGITPVVFQAKEALAVVNAASLAYATGACVLYDASLAMLLTQMATAMSVQSLRGRVESFHPTLHNCMPHPGQVEVAANLRHLLRKSKLAVQELDFELSDHYGILKQDRYALRSAGQWLAPALETLSNSIKTITIDINSANDNPIINHRKNEILHGANFQGTSATVAMDQSRQAIQLCGRLLFAQHSEMLNVGMSNYLPPNLCGSDPNIDFGLKGTDTAMASYMSELDFLCTPMTAHVHSAEMHNQSVNSMAMVSARMTQHALEILQMMIANIFLAHVQALDLRYLQLKADKVIEEILTRFEIPMKFQQPEIRPWYKFVFLPGPTAKALSDHIEVNGQKQKELITAFEDTMTELLASVDSGERVDDVASLLSDGTRPLYLYIRKELKIPFCDNKRFIDNMLETIYKSIKSRDIVDVVLAAFNSKQK